MLRENARESSNSAVLVNEACIRERDPRPPARWVVLGDYGIDVRFSMNEEFWYSRRFDPQLDPSRPPRELAVQWATKERKAIEASSDPK